MKLSKAKFPEEQAEADLDKNAGDESLDKGKAAVKNEETKREKVVAYAGYSTRSQN